MIKYHLEPIRIFQQLQMPGNASLYKKGSPLDNVKGLLRPYKKGFELVWPDNGHRFRGRSFGLGRQVPKHVLNVHGYHLIFEDLYIYSHRTESNIGRAIAASGGYVHTLGFSKTRNFYYQVLIPVSRPMELHYILESFWFTSDIGYRSADGTIAQFANYALQVCLLKHTDHYYIAIDSPIKQSYELFSEKVHSLKNALGYLSGFLAADRGCFFAYTRKNKKHPAHFFHTEWRNSIQSGYTPVYSNPYGYVRECRLADALYKGSHIRALTHQELGTLCQRLYDSKPFTSLIILILEASVASLLFMPGGFAIAMESLADLIIAPVKEKLAPIKTPALSKAVRSACTEVIKTTCADLQQEDLQVLLGRIEQLNQVTNKSRLRQPFEQLGIQLSAADLFVLQTRNDFLHGRTPDVTGAGEARTEQRLGLDLYYAAMRFYTLLNRLILKWVGYEGYILNHAKIQEKTTGISLKEPYYLKD